MYSSNHDWRFENIKKCKNGQTPDAKENATSANACHLDSSDLLRVKNRFSNLSQLNHFKT